MRIFKNVTSIYSDAEHYALNERMKKCIYMFCVRSKVELYVYNIRDAAMRSRVRLFFKEMCMDVLYI
jgi:hypothetical protein